MSQIKRIIAVAVLGAGLLIPALPAAAQVVGFICVITPAASICTPIPPEVPPVPPVP